MENLIYILIGIAWVAYSLYSARQKAIQKQQSSGLPPQGPSQSSPLPIPGNQSGGKNLFDEILRELTGETRPVPQVVEKPVMPVTPKHQKNVSELNQVYEGQSGYKFITKPSFESSHPDLGNNLKVQELREHLSNVHPVTTKFDLRQAVIYSELLNRKYF
jgi:hypothetical protein